ncbi:uncharacterized protein MYCFIDRAFT_176821 [Pseudocercospora fijiensis CIRAD86]|uniref:Uncharacterized protein n=1 Tax=Pseudocercospora fijiensis (strain CIRAD86) TaxID=383855 RepID=M3AWM2_PSEFD|nr:uncharacterized protein MYCFIDRAFT_176821 [Pseudocercospora fijiensis CIRAD86]EME81533.1 hypothetical protein MYCFIDRAFT_176821 [Pseudocercospora fijiensis CIRAD86]
MSMFDAISACAAMGQTSSQIDQVPRTQPDAQLARSPSPAASVHTSASRALARDLEESVYASAKKPTTKISATSDIAKGDATATVTARPKRRTRAAELRDDVKLDDIKNATDTADPVAEKERARPRKKRKTAQETEAEPEVAPKMACVQLPKSPAKAKQLDVPVMHSKSDAPAKKRGRPAKDLNRSDERPEDNQEKPVHEPIIVELTKAKVKKRKRVTEPEQATAGADAVENAEVSLHAEAGSSKPSRRRKINDVEEEHEPPEQLGGSTQASANPPDAVVDHTLLESKVAERTLTNEDMELERSDGEIDQEDLQRLKARNALRLQIKKWEEEELVYAGKAKWKNGKDGAKYLKLAQPGHKFKRPKLDAEQQSRADLESEARKQSISVTRDALLQVLVREDLMRALPHAHIPTAPDSGKEITETRKSQPVVQQAEEGPNENATRGTSEHVSDWLASQNEESPVPPEQLEIHQGSSKKRKRKSVLRADDDEDYQLDGSSVAPESANSASTTTKAARKEARRQRRESEMNAAPEKESDDGDDDEPPTAKRKSEAKKKEKMKKKKKKQSKDDTGSNAGRSGNEMIKGPFSQEEKDIADGIFAEVMRQEGLSEAELIAQIKNWRNCGTFKADMFEAFPRRTKDSIRKFAERRFHGMERGPWTAEQDQALRAAHTSHPGQWSQIGDLVGRTGADCRDRWRLQLQHENAVTGPWTVDEEEELLAAVEECIDAIKTSITDTSTSNNRDRLEALLNWTVVAQKLHGKRTGKRCHEKYGKLKTRRAKNEAALMGLGASSTTRVNQHTISGPSEDKKEAEKMRLARNTVTKSFEIGDYYDAFVEIHTAFKDHDRKFHDEKNVLWSIVSSKNMQSRFSVFCAPSALRRAAFEDAMEQWVAKEPKLKRKLEKARTIPAKALVLAAWLEKTYGNKLKNLTRKYRPELIGASKEELDKVKKDRRVKYGSRKLNTADNNVSKDMISDSDENESPAPDVEIADTALIPSENDAADENEHKATQVVPEIQEEVLKNGNDAAADAPSGPREHQKNAAADEQRMSDLDHHDNVPLLNADDFDARLEKLWAFSDDEDNEDSDDDDDVDVDEDAGWDEEAQDEKVVVKNEPGSDGDSADSAAFAYDVTINVLASSLGARQHDYLAQSQQKLSGPENRINSILFHLHMTFPQHPDRMLAEARGPIRIWWLHNFQSPSAPAHHRHGASSACSSGPQHQQLFKRPSAAAPKKESRSQPQISVGAQTCATFNTIAWWLVAQPDLQ